MRENIILIDYITWHYSRALKEGWQIWQNLLWFQLHFFGIPYHIKAFFSRFKGLGEEYPKGLVLSELATTFILNSLMRVLGIFLRIAIIVMGTIALLVVFSAGLIFWVVWVTFPLAVPAMWVIGILLMLNI